MLKDSMQVGVAMKSVLDQLHCIALIYFPKLENSLENIDETIVELGKNLSHLITCKATMIKVHHFSSRSLVIGLKSVEINLYPQQRLLFT